MPSDHEAKIQAAAMEILDSIRGSTTWSIAKIATILRTAFPAPAANEDTERLRILMDFGDLDTKLMRSDAEWHEHGASEDMKVGWSTGRHASAARELRCGARLLDAARKQQR